MTFIVSHNGKVYEKDLGKDSAAIGAKMSRSIPGRAGRSSSPNRCGPARPATGPASCRSSGGTPA